jgi:CheY-like chemotaxis protein
MTSHERRESIDIVLVDDNPADQEIARRVFGTRSARCRLEIVSDGHQALDYLERLMSHEDPSLHDPPDLILMDVNMPSLSGMEVLRRIKTDEALCHIPVLMLTTSSLESDVRQAYRLGCNSYIIKPVDVPYFTSLLDELLHY